MLHVHEERTKQAKTQEVCGGCERLQWGRQEVFPFSTLSRQDAGCDVGQYYNRIREEHANCKLMTVEVLEARIVLAA